MPLSALSNGSFFTPEVLISEQIIRYHAAEGTLPIPSSLPHLFAGPSRLRLIFLSLLRFTRLVELPDAFSKTFSSRPCCA